jgi:Resolvase, N terminal domain
MSAKGRGVRAARLQAIKSHIAACGHFRVSTDRQGKSGLGLEAQRKSVLDYLDGGRWDLVGEFTEIESGKHNDRPELEKALAACKKQKARLVRSRPRVLIGAARGQLIGFGWEDGVRVGSDGDPHFAQRCARARRHPSRDGRTIINPNQISEGLRGGSLSRPRGRKPGGRRLIADIDRFKAMPG